jgi:hypothetical protein
VTDSTLRARQRAAASGDPEAEASAERELARTSPVGWDSFVGHWVYLETPTMHWRGRCVGIVPGQHGALALSPCHRVHDWTDGEPQDACEMPSSPPALVPLGAVCYAGLQPAGWPTSPRRVTS